MKIINEYTGKEYNSVEECLKAEKEYLKAKEEAKAAEEAHRRDIEKARVNAEKAMKEYVRLLETKDDDFYADIDTLIRWLFG